MFVQTKDYLISYVEDADIMYVVQKKFLGNVEDLDKGYLIVAYTNDSLSDYEKEWAMNPFVGSPGVILEELDGSPSELVTTIKVANGSLSITDSVATLTFEMETHASEHTDGSDDIQDATASVKGLATAAQITKLDGIEALADVTSSNETSHSDVLVDGDIGIADDKLLEMDDAGPANVGEYVRLTANGLAGRTGAETRGDLGLEIGVDVLGQQTKGIANDNLVEVDGSPSDNEYAKWTVNGLEGRSKADHLIDLNVADGADVSFKSLQVSDLGDAATPSVLTTAETTNKCISNYKSSGADHVFTMPAAHVLGNIIFTIGDEFQVDIEPNGSDLFYLNGTAMAADEHIVNVADTLGEQIVGYCVNINGTLRWMFYSSDANWAEATP